jgi:hypothetical protein
MAKPQPVSRDLMGKLVQHSCDLMAKQFNYNTAT